MTNPKQPSEATHHPNNTIFHHRKCIDDVHKKIYIYTPLETQTVGKRSIFKTQKINVPVQKVIKNHINPFAAIQEHQKMRLSTASKRKEVDPPTIQAISAAARSSRPRVASRAQGTGAAKIR